MALGYCSGVLYRLLQDPGICSLCQGLGSAWTCSPATLYPAEWTCIGVIYIMCSAGWLHPVLGHILHRICWRQQNHSAAFCLDVWILRDSWVSGVHYMNAISQSDTQCTDFQIFVSSCASPGLSRLWMWCSTGLGSRHTKSILHEVCCRSIGTACDTDWQISQFQFVDHWKGPSAPLDHNKVIMTFRILYHIQL